MVQQPSTTSLFLERAVRDLQQLQSDAKRVADDRLALFIYILDTALVEAREQLRK